MFILIQQHNYIFKCTIEPLISNLGITDLVNHKVFLPKSVLNSITTLKIVHSKVLATAWSFDLDCCRRHVVFWYDSYLLFSWHELSRPMHAVAGDWDCSRQQNNTLSDCYLLFSQHKLCWLTHVTAIRLGSKFCRRQRRLFTALLTHLIAVFLNRHVVLFVKEVPLLL